MPRASPEMTAEEARVLLRIGGPVGAEALAAAFRDAAKLAHPDVAGGDAERFRRVVAAYRLLQTAPPPGPFFAPAPARPSPPRPQRLEITPLIAAQGGAVTAEAGERLFKVILPAGLREGDKVRVGDVVLPVSIQGGFEALVRGHDLWLTVKLPSALLADGGRATLETPLGRRTVWISGPAARRRLVRLAEQGLPARGKHPAGHLFLRLEGDAATASVESPARKLLKRFAAAWAA